MNKEINNTTNTATVLPLDCNAFRNELPDLILTENAVPSPAAAAHLRTCPPCMEEYLSFQRTFGLLDSWKPVEPTPYFDTRLQARLREEQATHAMGWLERLQTRLLFNTGRSFRPALAGAMALVLAVGGGSLAGINYHAGHRAPEASATVQDLQILDRNEQAFQQLDELQKDDDEPEAPAAADTQIASPTS